MCEREAVDPETHGGLCPEHHPKSDNNRNPPEEGGSPGSYPGEKRLPWHSDPQGEAKTRIWRYLLNQLSGAPIPTIVKHLFAVDTNSEQTAYNRALSGCRRI